MKKNCENCGTKFEAKRKTARFCTDKCRKAFERKPGLVGTVVEAPCDITHSEFVPSNQKLVSPVKINKVDANPASDRMIATAKRLGITIEEAQSRMAGFEKMGLSVVKWITTGIPELDKFQQIPRGRVTQIQGPYAVGKTTLALNMIRGLADKKVFYVDSEAALNPELLFELGLSNKNFHLYNESAFIEDMYEQVVTAARSGIYDMIILDSLAACTTRTEDAGDATASNIGQKAKIVNKLMRIVPMDLKNNDTALVIINQERDVIGSYVPQKYTPGGMGPVYAASLILQLKTIPSWRFPKDAKNGAYKGHEIQVTVMKSKVSQPHRKAMIKLYYLNPDADVKVVDESVTVEEF
jgi:RecA/RadA recombinase